MSLLLTACGVLVDAQANAQPEARALTIRTSAGLHSFCYSPDGKCFAYSHFEGITVEVKAVDGKKISTLKDNQHRIQALAFSPDGRTLASGGLGAPLSLWDVTTGKASAKLAERTNLVPGLVFSPNGKSLAVADTTAVAETTKIDLWDVTTRKVLSSVDVPRSYRIAVSYNAAGDTLAVGTDDGAIHLIDTKAGKVRARLTGPPMTRVFALAYSADGKVLHAGYSNSTLGSWDLATNQSEMTKLARQGECWSLAFSPDRRYLALGDQNGFVSLWNVGTGRRVQVFEPRFNHRVEVVAFSPDGKWLTAADWGFINLFDSINTEWHTTWLRVRSVRPDDMPKK